MNGVTTNRNLWTLAKAIAFFSACVFVFSCQQAAAQARFSASAPKSVPLNQNFQLSFTLDNANGNNLRPPVINDFQVMGGPNTSSSMQFGGGTVQQSSTYSYILRPKKEGTFKIGKASINVAGANMESNEVTIEVTKPVAQPPQTQRQPNPFDPFGDMQEEEQPQANQGDLQKELKDDVFARLSINKSSVYKGEMLTATYKLYFRYNLGGLNISKSPVFDGFWSQEVELDPKRRPTIENLNGKQYNVIEVLKYNLYPQRAGTLQVNSPEIGTVVQVQVRSRSRSIFDDFFNMGSVQQVPMTLKTTPSAVNVKELPDAGKPTDFSGAVGKFNFETTLSSKQGKTDDPITYSIKISGAGNIKLIEAPELAMPSAFEVYDPKVKENISNGAAGMSGSKQYDYLIIPRQPGDYTIESKSFTYFDPATVKYITIQSPEYALNITGEASKDVNASTAGVSKKDIQDLKQDIRYIKTDLPEFRKGGSMLGMMALAGMYTTPVLLFIGLVVWKRRNETLAADIVGTKRRKALKLAKKRLSVAEKHLAQNDRKGFYDEVSRAIWGYLGNKLNIDNAELSKDNVQGMLLARNVKQETISKLNVLVNNCEMALYAPSEGSSELKDNYNSALNLIADLEDEIK